MKVVIRIKDGDFFKLDRVIIELKSVEEKVSSFSVCFFSDDILILLHACECEGFT